MLRVFLDGVLKMGATIIVLCGGFTACRDNSSPDSAAVSQRSSPAATIRKESHLKAEMAWVGQAHNKALDDLRAELRKPGLMTNNACDYVSAFTAKTDRFPDAKATGRAKDRLSIAKSALKEVQLCKSDPTSSLVMQEAGAYSNMSALAQEIMTAIELASDRYDLAQRLSPLWTTAAALNESESAIIAASLATAQSSFEYWEVHVDQAFREFEAEYSDCARTSSSDGTDYDQARRFCLEGGLLPTIGPRYAPSPLRIAGLVPKRGCGLTGHWKSLAKADAGGAFGGAVKGALTGGLAGIGSGALIGGIAGSAGSWINSAWELYKCALT